MAVTRGGPRVAAVDDVDERGHRLARKRPADRSRLRPFGARVLAAGAEVDRDGAHPVLVVESRRVFGDQTSQLRAVGRDHRAGLAATRTQPRRASDPGADRAGEVAAGNSHARRYHGDERQRHQQDQRQPLRGRLAALVGSSHASRKPATCGDSRAARTDTVPRHVRRSDHPSQGGARLEGLRAGRGRGPAGDPHPPEPAGGRGQVPVHQRDDPADLRAADRRWPRRSDRLGGAARPPRRTWD